MYRLYYRSVLQVHSYGVCRVVFPVWYCRLVVVNIILWYRSLTTMYHEISRVQPSPTFGYDTTDDVAVNPDLQILRYTVLYRYQSYYHFNTGTQFQYSQPYCYYT